MNPHRPVFASVLLAVVLLGGTLAPAVHWASHGLAAHDAHHAPAEFVQVVPVSETEHGGPCLDCACLQKAFGAEVDTRPFYADIVGLERAVPPPEAPTTQADTATHEERGPPAVA